MAITAAEVREWAKSALNTNGVETGHCAYYVINGANTYVAKNARGCLFGVNFSVDLLEDGTIIFWFQRECFNLKNEAGKLAKRLNEWRKRCA